MEELISCLVLSSPPRLLLPSQVPELTPTTLSFLGFRGPVARDMDSCISYDSKHAAGVCLGTIQARTLMFNWRLHVSGRRYATNTGYGSPCNTCTDTLGTWVLNVLIMPLRLVHLASSPVTILPLAGFIITLTHLLVVVTVTTSVTSWKNGIALELKQHRYLRTRVSAVFLIGFFVSLTHAFASLVVLLSAFLSCVHFVRQEKQWKAQLRLSLPRRVLVKVSQTTCGILSWSCYFTNILAVSCCSLLMNLTWPNLLSLVILLWIYSATRKVLTVLHDVSSGTIACGNVSIVTWHHRHTCNIGVLDF